MSNTAPLRVLRSAGITSVGMSLAAGAHVAGGGVLPTPALMAGLGVILLVPAAALSGRRFSLSTLAGLLGLGQVALHGALASLSTPGRCAPVMAAQHLRDDAAPCAGPAAGLAPAQSHLSGLPDTVLMLPAHAGAVLLTILVLAKGDAALFHLRAWLRPLLTLPRTADLPVHRQAPVWTQPDASRPARRLDHNGLRGPPLPRFPVTATP